MPRTSIPDLHEKYREGNPLTMLTAYDAPIARQSTVVVLI
jgi:3-methyl-2-oxobutanoate hydroxymethyltransferase